MRKTILFFLLSFPAFGAGLTTTAQAFVQTGGSDSNAGWFDPGVSSPGTNEALNNSGTSVSITLASGTTGTSSPAFTSTTHGPGNTIIITGGTGCTTGIYVLLSQSSGTGTFNATMGSATDVCTGTLGGALLTICGTYSSGCQTGAFTHAISNTSALVIINVKAGTYSIGSVTIVNANSSGLSVTPVEIFGYTTTPGDWGSTRPVITTASNVSIVQFTNSGAAAYINNFLYNLVLQSTTTSYATCMLYHYNTGSQGFELVGVKFDHSVGGSSFSAGICTYQGSAVMTAVVENSEFAMGSNDAGIADHGNSNGYTAPFSVSHSWFHGGKYGMWDDDDSHLDYWILDHDAFSSNGTGVYQQGSGVGIQMSNCAFYNQSGVNVESSTTTLFYLLDVNNIFDGGTYGFSIGSGTGPGLQFGATNAFANISTANYLGALPSSTWGNPDIALGTCHPFNNPTSGDFSLNPSSGCYSSLVGKGYPGVIAPGTGYQTPGILDPKTSSGGTGGAYVQ